ncbi:hypothetical protein D3C73_1619300 [compost metagenome]
MQHRTRLQAVLFKGGAQGLVTSLQLREGCAQGVAVQRALEAQRGRDVVGRALWVQLPENPLTLLGV